MKVAILVDYASLYHSVWGSEDSQQLPRGKHDETLELLRKLEQYVANRETRCLRGVQEVTRHVFLLDRSPFRDCAALARASGFAVSVTPWRRRTASENNRNFSADDDYVLKHTVLRLMATVDAFVLVTTDADFSPTIDMIRHSGRLAVLAAYERHGHRLSRTLRERADEVLPLQEIALDRDEAEPLQTADNVVSEIERGSVEDTVIELFHRGRRLLQFPLHASEVEIGRRSVRLGHFPHLDVTDFDPDRTVSRRHLRVRETMERQVFLQVRSSCSRGTWMNGNPIFPGETVQVQEGDNIVFGSREDGFGLRLRLPVVVTVREVEIG